MVCGMRPLKVPLWARHTVSATPCALDLHWNVHHHIEHAADVSDPLLGEEQHEYILVAPMPWLALLVTRLVTAAVCSFGHSTYDTLPQKPGLLGAADAAVVLF